MYDIIIHDMRVLHDLKRGYRVYVHPHWTLPVAVDVTWEKGRAKVVLGTWRHIGGPPPADLVDLLRANEAYLWMTWMAAHPLEPWDEVVSLEREMSCR